MRRTGRTPSYRFCGLVASAGALLLLGAAGGAEPPTFAPAPAKLDGWTVAERMLVPRYDGPAAKWSPDGERLLVAGSRSAGKPYPDPEMTVRSLSMVEAGSGRADILREHRWGKDAWVRPWHWGWMPDGKSLFVNHRWWSDAEGGADRLVLVDLEDGREEVLPHEFDWQSPLAVMPDGRRFVSVLRGRLQVAPIGEKGRGRARVKSLAVAGFTRGKIIKLMARSPHGVLVGTLQYPEEREAPTVAQLFEWDLDHPERPPQPIPLRVPPDGHRGWLLSPNGNQLLYDAGPGERTFYPVQGKARLDAIDVFDLPTGRSRTLVRFRERDDWLSPASWSPDGRRWLGVQSWRGSRTMRIRIHELESSRFTEVALPRPADPGEMVMFSAPVWSPDGRWVATVFNSYRPHGRRGPGKPPDDRPLEYRDRIGLVNVEAGRFFLLEAKAREVEWSPQESELAALQWGKLRILSLSRQK